MKSGFCLCPASWQMLLAFLRRSKAGKILAKRIINRSFTAGNPAAEIRFKLHKAGTLGDPPRRKRRFSRKQLAAQRLFAKRAKAGTLRRKRRR